MANDRTQFELPAETVNALADALGFNRPITEEAEEPAEETEPEDEPEVDLDEEVLTEGVTTKRLNGHIVFSGFNDKVVGSIPPELKFRILANRTGSRVRLIIDVKA